MRIIEVEKLFKSEETLDKVLDEIKDDIEKIDNIAEFSLKKNLADNPQEAKKALNSLTGIYLNLKAILAIAETEKKNREIRAYDTIRINIEKAGDKFVSASAEKQASLAVAKYRRIRNIIQGYADACNTAISSLQSILKYEASALHLEKE